MRFLLTQFGRGAESMRRVVTLALAVNREMDRRGKERYRILVPWLHGDRQRRFLNNEFATEHRQYPDEILLDERLGRILSPFLGNDINYAASIAIWVAGWEDTGRVVRDHFNRDITVMNLDGRLLDIPEPNIALELNQAPSFHIGAALAYQVTSCRQSQLFAVMNAAPSGTFALGRELIASARKVAEEIERNLCRTYLSVPGTFIPAETFFSDTLGQEFIPPTVTLPALDNMFVPPSSVYVTVPDAPGANENLRVALTWGVPVFTNDPERLGGGQWASAGLLRHPNIQFHFARGDWESIYASLLGEKPLLAVSSDSYDDPEIHFNIQKMTEWRLACSYERETFSRQQSILSALLPHIKNVKEKLRAHFGTLDGTTVAAQRIVDDLLQ